MLFKGLNYEAFSALMGSQIGWEFEFYSNFSRLETAKLLSKYLNKEVVYCDYYHTDVDIDENTFKLEPDFSGGKKMMELVTGPLQYNEAKIILSKVLKWIKKNGHTTNKCAIQPNISFNPMKVELATQIKDIDILKFCLSVDEDFVYSRFPSRKDSIYTRSIKKVIPRNIFSFQGKINSITKQNYIVPNQKYYGVNFTKLHQNYIEIRYIGGKNYENKINKIYEIVDYFIILIYELTKEGSNPDYTEENVRALNKQLKILNKTITNLKTYESFITSLGKKINLSVDLKYNSEIIRSKYTQLRAMLFDLLSKSSLEEAEINYDSDVSRYQIKNGKLGDTHMIKNFDLINCEISGSIENCSLYGCEIKNSTLSNCHIASGNELKKSKVIDSPVDAGNILEECYIKLDDMVFNGETIKGVFRSGIIGNDAIIDKNTLVVEKDKKIPDRKDKDDSSKPKPFF